MPSQLGLVRLNNHAADIPPGDCRGRGELSPPFYTQGVTGGGD